MGIRDSTGGAELKPFRIRVRAVLTAVAVTALAAVSLSPQSADARSVGAPRTLPEPLAGELARTLVGRLDGAVAGAYYDSGAHRLVVDVTDRKAADAVRKAGAVPKEVTYSQVQLDTARVTLDAMPAIPGTAWVADPRINRVVVSADPTVTGDRLARLNRTVKSLGDAVLVRRTSAKLTRYIAGGDGIFGAKYRCSLGFNVVDASGGHGFVTAGHCGSVEPQWAPGPGAPWIGKTVGAEFPGVDHAFVQHTDGTIDHPGAVNLYNGTTQPITQAADPMVDQAVTRSGSTTHVHEGKVTGVGATVNYPEGTVRGLIQTTVCAEGGDSGGPLFSGTTGYGILSGGSGNCMTGGTSYYEPLTRALGAYNVRLG
ncbi:S1 family peptidase [Streptomyces sp. UNOC14_S4]|uniref:S1 family peptidase n=1 Tax=Streptomyces sp. UNOC14_S4 TaxID=2872340 RepID=UPI001E5885E5|nr:S1 family peptidase [Streptomyces sp. UNOC14_S4]MCC3770673.1 S1 family peptidase [Streptomyces sp. UNOC14_S4]